MHVPRLERLLAAYGTGEPDVFAATFIGWDRECSDEEAARIVTELLAVFVDEKGTLVRPQRRRRERSRPVDGPVRRAVFD